MQDLNERIPDSEMMDGFVTWSALEDTLRGLRDQLNEVQTHPSEQSNTENVPNKRIVVEVGNQTDAVNNSMINCYKLSFKVLDVMLSGLLII